MILASYSATASAAGSPHNHSGASSPVLKQDGEPPAQPPQLFTARDRRRAAQKQRSASQSQADAEVATSGDLTAALRRTHDLISAELSRSEFAQQVLNESTAAMKELQQRYSTLDDLLTNSRDLLGTLLKSQKSDTWYLETALYMLMGTLFWLVFRRFLYGPLWWIVWLPLRTVFRTGKAVSNVGMGGTGGGARMEVAQPGDAGPKVVGVGEESAVPTVNVGGSRNQEAGDPESLVEKVGKIIEDNLGDKYDDTTGSSGDQPGHDTQRRTQEAEHTDERLRDEL